MVSERDLAAINEALLQGYDVYIRLTKDGYKIVAEKLKAKVTANERQSILFKIFIFFSLWLKSLSIL